jgi:hypothetical protein
MKAKKKFDPKLAQQFMIDHTEKFVVGLVAALLLFFAYQSVALPHYDKTTERLKSATEQARQRIAQAGPANAEKIAAETKYLPYAEIIDGARQPVNPSDYPMQFPLNWKPTPPLHLRGAPNVLAVEDLRAIPGRGAMVAAGGGNGAGGAATVGKRWITVTGLVPRKKQDEEFKAKLEGAAQETQNDKPQYAGYFIQRAEVVPGAATAPKWDFSIFVSGAAEAAAKMGNRTAPEIADSEFVHPNLTSPLPDVTNFTWGDEAVCPPKIPVAPPKPALAVGGLAPNGQPAPPPVGIMDRPGGTLDTFRPGRGRTRPPVRGNQVNPGAMNPINPAGPPSVGGLGDVLNSAPAPAKPGAAEPAADAAQTKEEPDYYLLRYVDFNVKANKQYQYRVFPVLLNPNFNLSPTVLEQQDFSTAKFLGPHGNEPISVQGKLEWPLDPGYSYSPAVTSLPMSDELRVLAGKVSGARWPKESEATIRVLLWLEDTGLFGSFSREGLIRGTVLDFPRSQVKIPDGQKGTKDILLKSILVDVQGGEAMKTHTDPNLITPGLILLMDGSGNLVMHDELAETQEWDDATRQPDDVQPSPRPIPREPRHQAPSADSGDINSNDLGGGGPAPARPKRPGR